MLTCKQYELLLFIHNHTKETGVPPSFEEMKNALELSSKSGIHKLIIALEQRGFIRRLPNRARAVEVIRLPEKITFNLSLARKISPSMIEKKKREISKSLSNLDHFDEEEKKYHHTYYGTYFCECAYLCYTATNKHPFSPTRYG